MCLIRVRAKLCRSGPDLRMPDLVYRAADHKQPSYDKGKQLAQLVCCHGYQVNNETVALLNHLLFIKTGGPCYACGFRASYGQIWVSFHVS